MRKILYSPRYGGGWYSWNRDIPAKFMCEYQPIIDVLEKGEKLYIGESFKSQITEAHPVLQQFYNECKEKFGVEPYLGGAPDLQIEEVEDDVLVKIDEYDGYESVEYLHKSNFEYF